MATRVVYRTTDGESVEDEYGSEVLETSHDLVARLKRDDVFFGKRTPDWNREENYVQTIIPAAGIAAIDIYKVEDEN